MLIDSHAHITDEIYGDGGKAIIESMAADGLKAIVVVGCDAESSRKNVEVARNNENIYASVGVHPYYPETLTDALIDEFRGLARDPKTVAIGEFGLDYHHDVYDRKAQLKAQDMQYALARELKLPMIFHVREATGDFVDFLRAAEFPESGVMHCFSGSVETAKICLDKGLYIAFGGKLTYNNSKHIQEVAKYAPLDRILVETDAPYLSPAKHLGEVNYPKYVADAADKLAELRKTPIEEIARATTENAERLFFKMRNK